MNMDDSDRRNDEALLSRRNLEAYMRGLWIGLETAIGFQGSLVGERIESAGITAQPRTKTP